VNRISSKIREEIDELQRIRDELRLKLHLGGAELKQRWERVEQRWPQIEERLSSAGTKADDAADALRSVLHDVRAAYDELRKEIRL